MVKYFVEARTINHPKEEAVLNRTIDLKDSDQGKQINAALDELNRLARDFVKDATSYSITVFNQSDNVGIRAIGHGDNLTTAIADVKAQMTREKEPLVPSKLG